MSVSIRRSFPSKAAIAVENPVTAALAISFLATIMLVVSGGPAFAAATNTQAVAAETMIGVVEGYSVTLKLRDGTTRTFAVAGDTNLGYADDGDEVRVTIQKNKITSIRLAYPTNDRK